MMLKAKMYYYDEDGSVVDITYEPLNDIGDALDDETDIMEILSDEQRENLIKVIYKICVIHHITQLAMEK